MRQIARHSAGLASCQRLRFLGRPRTPFWQHTRLLQTTCPRLSEQRPPDGPAGNRNELDEQRERERRVAEEIRQDYSGDGSFGEARRPGLRRTMRQRRLVEVPKPPELPRWFLKGNVELAESRDGWALGSTEGTRDLRCVDVKTAEEVLRFVNFPVESREQQEKEEGRKAEEAKEQVEKLSREKEEQAKKASIPGINMFDNNFFEKKFEGHVPPVLLAGGDSPLGFKFPHTREEQGMQHDPLTWTLLETEASARAAISVSAQNNAGASHAASRSDIHLYCPDSNAHEQMDQYVRDLASVLDANLIRLDANDFADLTDDYVGSGHDSPGSFSTLGYEVFDGNAATGVGIRGSRPDGGAPFEKKEQDEAEEEEDEEEDPNFNNQSGINLGHFESFDDLRKTLHERRHELGKMLGTSIAGVSLGMPDGSPFVPAGRKPSKKKEDYVQWDDSRLTALLDHVLDAKDAKRELISRDPKVQSISDPTHPSSVLLPRGQEVSSWPQRAVTALVDIFDKIGRGKETSNLATRIEGAGSTTPDHGGREYRRTVVQVRDLKQLTSSKLGETIVRRLVRVVQKRRQMGEDIVVVGTTASHVEGPLEGVIDAHEDSPFRLLMVPPLFGLTKSEREAYESNAVPIPTRALTQPPSYDRIMEINFRHIRSMLLRLEQGEIDIVALEESLKQLRVPGTSILSELVLPQDQVQRLVLTAIGFKKSYAKSDTVTPAHIGLAAAVLSRADHTVHSWQAWRDAQQMNTSKFKGFGKGPNEFSEQTSGQARMEALKKTTNPHETRLLTGVVDSQNIKTGFDDVHATPETIEALKSLTTLSLQRPDAFKYGVLANDRLTGLLLYGPPGTGKTLLAKAVAKESSATVLEVSGAQVYEKYVGEGEKMVRAVFSLAKKLSPCVVFIDEADAIFGSRGGGSGSRNTHREIINQFLREWDGMDDNSVFMMVASNRPFDLDDAVLRRLPRRCLVDLPVAKDREAILGIHLRNERLDGSVSLEKLAEQTPLYSGSDLKNLCVSAALAAVREENELAAEKKGDKEFKLPEKRTLMAKHFEKAVQEISASISEDMGSLTAIRKFDEQFGDRRGRKKKSGYGFGTGGEGVDEGAARVRGGK